MHACVRAQLRDAAGPINLTAAYLQARPERSCCNRGSSTAGGAEMPCKCRGRSNCRQLISWTGMQALLHLGTPVAVANKLGPSKWQALGNKNQKKKMRMMMRGKRR
mmetsp:Transcript_75980/g.158452  ORF Transcript_75980/g.158452 Transcript_75980/m.158452 type:complete len:106 (+) Transcript_75980:574-891(+)